MQKTHWQKKKEKMQHGCLITRNSVNLINIKFNTDINLASTGLPVISAVCIPDGLDICK